MKKQTLPHIKVIPKIKNAENKKSAKLVEEFLNHLFWTKDFQDALEKKIEKFFFDSTACKDSRDDIIVHV